MKKAILIILVLILTSVALVGCISVLPHKLFSDPWLNNEVATYVATRTIHDKNKNDDDDKTIVGTTVMTTSRLNNQTITVGTAVIENFSGTTVTIDTVFPDDSIMKSMVAFKSTFEPVASHKYINVKGYENTDPTVDIEQEYQLVYGDKKATYTQEVDTVVASGEIELGKWQEDPYYDNLMVHHLARSSYKYEDEIYLYNPISLDVISTSTMELKTLTTSRTDVTAINLSDEEPVKDAEVLMCDLVSISLSQEFPGSGQPLEALFNNVTLKAPHAGIDFTTADRRLVQFKEGSIVYKLTSFTERD